MARWPKRCWCRSRFPGKRRRLGKLVSDILRPASPERDPLAALIAELKADAAADGLTDGDIDAELAAYNAGSRV